MKIHDAELVFAPCDGRVVVTEMVHESEYLDREMLQISIFMVDYQRSHELGAGRRYRGVFQVSSGAFPGGVASQVLDRERADDDRRANPRRQGGCSSVRLRV